MEVSYIVDFGLPGAEKLAELAVLLGRQDDGTSKMKLSQHKFLTTIPTLYLYLH